MLVPDKRRFPRSHFFRLALSLALIAVVAFASLAQVRPMEISRYVQPAATTFFSKFGKFAGGIVPRGEAEFYSPANVKLNPSELKLVILDQSKLRDAKADFDVVGIEWKGNKYRLMAQDNLIYRQMKFIQRDGHIVYTITDKYDEVYFDGESLVESCERDSYVAKEFALLEHRSFLDKVDLSSSTEKLPRTTEAAIIRNLSGSATPGGGNYYTESYLNADFDVKYQVFLEDRPNGDRVATVGGLPLRYHWDGSSGNSVTVKGVEVFAFPEEEKSLQYRAVLFFQATAILRQFSNSNKPAFSAFLNEVETTLSPK